MTSVQTPSSSIPAPEQAVPFNLGGEGYDAVLKVNEPAQGMGRENVQMRRVGIENIKTDEVAVPKTMITTHGGEMYEADVTINLHIYNSAGNRMLFSGNTLGNWGPAPPPLLPNTDGDTQHSTVTGNHGNEVEGKQRGHKKFKCGVWPQQHARQNPLVSPELEAFYLSTTDKVLS